MTTFSPSTPIRTHTPRLRWVGITCLALLLLGGGAGWWYAQHRRDLEFLEKIAQQTFEPPLFDDTYDPVRRRDVVLQRLATERGATVEALKERLRKLARGGPLGIRLAGYHEAIVDVALDHAASALREANLAARENADWRAACLAGDLYVTTREWTEAEAAYRQAGQLLQKRWDARANLALLARQAYLRERQERFAEAQKLWEEIVTATDAMPERETPDLTRALVRVGALTFDHGVRRKAVPWVDRAEPLIKSYPSLLPGDLGYFYNIYGGAIEEAGRIAEAEAALRFAITSFDAECGPNDRRISGAVNNLGLLLLKLNRPAEAEPFIKRALEMVKPRAATAPGLLVNPIHNYCQLLVRLGRPAEAESEYLAAIEILERLQGKKHLAVAETYEGLGLVYRMLDRRPEAERAYRRAIAIYEPVAEKEWAKMNRVLNNLAVNLRTQDRYTEAERVLLRSIDLTDRHLPQDAPERATGFNNLGSLLNHVGRFPEAETILRRAISIALRDPNRLATVLPIAYNNLVEALFAQKRLAESEDFVRRGLDFCREHQRTGGENAELYTELLDKMKTLLKLAGRSDDDIRRELARWPPAPEPGR